GVLRDALDVGRDERTEETIRNYINNLRRAIGSDHLPDAKKAGRYKIVGVSTDEARFRALVTKAATDPGLAMEHLATALSLVRGEPFANRPAGRYAWAYERPVATSLVNHVRTSAIKLGDLALEASNTALATWAAEQALRACPKEFELLELKLRAGALAGRGSLNRAWVEITKSFQGPDDKVPPELAAFYEAEVRKPRPHQTVD
ncbi:MAG TPA: bacterial transcriptional activator domain-containing protein, partial [Acidimicrobiales bacterium]|nr:bacterial transcriptional activator domain-containing protein [Acidimicrobiales bacterium]